MTARTITFVILSAWLIAPSHAADLVVARYGETISHEKNDLYLSAEFRWLDPDTVAIVFENPLSIHIYDVGTKKLTQTLTLEPKDSFQAFSNDGRWLITSSHDGNWWHVYKRESGKLTHRVIAPDEPIHRFQVSPDAKRMVTQALRHHNAVRAWDLIHGRQLWSIPSPRSSGEIHFVGTRKEFQEVIVARCDVAPNRIEAREFESGNITISVGLSRNLGTYEQRSLMARLHPDQNQVICPTITQSTAILLQSGCASTWKTRRNCRKYHVTMASSTAGLFHPTDSESPVRCFTASAESDWLNGHQVAASMMR